MERPYNHVEKKSGVNADEQYRRMYEEMRSQLYKEAYEAGYRDGRSDGYHSGYHHATQDHHHNERAARQNHPSDMHWHGRKSKSWLYV